MCPNLWKKMKSLQKKKHDLSEIGNFLEKNQISTFQILPKKFARLNQLRPSKDWTKSSRLDNTCKHLDELTNLYLFIIHLIYKTIFIFIFFYYYERKSFCFGKKKKMNEKNTKQKSIFFSAKSNQIFKRRKKQQKLNLPQTEK